MLITSMHGVSLWLMAAQLHIQLIMQACVEWLESSLPKRLVVDVLAGWLAASGVCHGVVTLGRLLTVQCQVTRQAHSATAMTLQ